MGKRMMGVGSEVVMGRDVSSEVEMWVALKVER